MQLDPTAHQFYHVFMNHALSRRQAAEASGQRFVHYTGPEAAFGMLKNGEVWLRKSSVMNDFQEVHYGVQCLGGVWNNADGQRLKQHMNSLFPGMTAKMDNLLNAQVPVMQYDTYLSCISEHDPDEDRLGRLSMWRAYGGVAIVLNPAIFMSSTTALQVLSSPVMYQTPAAFAHTFKEMVDRVEASLTFLKQQGEEAVLGWLTFAMKQAILCTKHPGFKEEREWRIIYVPEATASPFIEKTIELVRGVAQPVIKLKLRDDPQLGIYGLAPGSLIERIIIGPSQFPSVQHEAYSTMLGHWGVADAFNRVYISDIPLRQ